VYQRPPTCISAHPRVSAPTHVYQRPPTCISAHPRVSAPSVRRPEGAAVQRRTCQGGPPGPARGTSRPMWLSRSPADPAGPPSVPARPHQSARTGPARSPKTDRGSPTGPGCRAPAAPPAQDSDDSSTAGRARGRPARRWRGHSELIRVDPGPGGSGCRHAAGGGCAVGDEWCAAPGRAAATARGAARARRSACAAERVRGACAARRGAAQCAPAAASSTLWKAPLRKGVGM
jgi:hypothetical protein